jgi:hypothetical protein
MGDEDAAVATYIDTLDEDGQVDFKKKAKAFVRTYRFLASILPFPRTEQSTIWIGRGVRPGAQVLRGVVAAVATSRASVRELPNMVTH